MILTCPSCATRYQTDEAKFPPEGRQVRCAKCSHVWHQAALVAEALEAEAPVIPATVPQTPRPEAPAAEKTAPQPEPVRAPRPQSVSTPGRTRQPLLPMLAVAFGWIGLIAVVLLIGLSAVRYRQEITVIWPQSAGVYSSLGMNVNAHGIDFTDVDYHRESEDGQVVLAVTGRIINKGSRELPVPQNVRVTLSDASNHELYHWNFAPGIQTLKAGQTTSFHTRLSNPPATARHLEVRFAKDDK
jgi:predicted Zn finger-like uncharacterized protein